MVLLHYKGGGFLMEEFTVEYVEMWRKWNDLEGNSSRREYWMAYLVNFIVLIILGALGRIAGIFNIIDGIYGFAILIPSITLFVRRMHDIGKSGWSWLWGFLPIVGWIYVIYLLAQPTK